MMVASATLFMNPKQKQQFADIYKKWKSTGTNRWFSSESASGKGSELQNTVLLRSNIQNFCKRYEIKSIVDCPCGDFNVMKELDYSGINYIGLDVVPELIKDNQERYEQENITFKVLDLTEKETPQADLVIVKDLLLHLSINNAHNCIKNVIKSGSKYLLINHSPYIPKNENKKRRAIYGNEQYNLLINPFNLTKPMCLMGASHKPWFHNWGYFIFDLHSLTTRI